MSVRDRITLAKVWALLGSPQLTGEQAGKLAARQVAREMADERKQQRHDAHPSHQPNNKGGDLLLNRLWGILVRQEARAAPRPPRPHTDDDIPAGGDVPRGVDVVVRKAPQPNPLGIVGVWPSHVTGAVRIDHEFEPRGVFDETTRSYRHSISENARIQKEREEHWAKRLIELKREGKLS